MPYGDAMIRMTARDATTCSECRQPIAVGDAQVIEAVPGYGGTLHPACADTMIAAERAKTAARRQAQTPRRTRATEGREVDGYMIDRGEDN